MIPLVGLIAALQAGPPTVGDTIWLTRRVDASAGVEVRPARWQLSGEVELLGRAVLRREGDQIVVAYPVTAWRPGTHVVLVPGPIIIRADGRSDSLPVERVTLDVASVLPTDRDRAEIPVQPAARIVPRYVTSVLPLLVTLLLASGLFGLVAWLWLRRGPPLPPVTPPVVATPVDVGSWIEAGELRAVAALAAGEIRSLVARLVPGARPGLDTDRLGLVLAEHRPAWPVAAITATLGELERTAFGDVEPEDALELFERARDLTESLSRSSA